MGETGGGSRYHQEVQANVFMIAGHSALFRFPLLRFLQATSILLRLGSTIIPDNLQIEGPRAAASLIARGQLAHIHAMAPNLEYHRLRDYPMNVVPFP